MLDLLCTRSTSGRQDQSAALGICMVLVHRVLVWPPLVAPSQRMHNLHALH